jgi:hypothetical protein
MLLRDVNSLARTLPVIHKKLALLSIILILMLDVFAMSPIQVSNVMLMLCKGENARIGSCDNALSHGRIIVCWVSCCSTQSARFYSLQA